MLFRLTYKVNTPVMSYPIDASNKTIIMIHVIFVWHDQSCRINACGESCGGDSCGTGEDVDNASET
jgi:hypothetical protein